MYPSGAAESARPFDGRAPLSRPAFLRDMLLSLLFAVLTGILGGLMLILLVFGFNTAQAQETPTQGRLELYALDGRPLPAAPLLHSDVSMQITGMLASVRLEQRFSNPRDQWLEGIYQFPLPDGSAVERMRMLVGERVIEGRIEEKQKARQVYQAARAAGQRASLLTQERPNIFTSSVANIAPGEELRVIIEYQQTLLYTQRGFELRFPLVVGPRYIPGSPLASAISTPDGRTGWARDTDQVPDASRIKPPLGFKIGDGVDLRFVGDGESFNLLSKLICLPPQFVAVRLCFPMSCLRAIELFFYGSPLRPSGLTVTRN